MRPNNVVEHSSPLIDTNVANYEDERVDLASDPPTPPHSPDGVRQSDPHLSGTCSG